MGPTLSRPYNAAMPHDTPPRPRREPHSTVAASLPLTECLRLHAIAEAKQVTLSTLLRDALTKAYPIDTTT